MNEPNNFCVLPWIHLETSANGFARPCCIYSGHYKNSDNSNVSMQDTSITQAMNSYGAEQIRKAFSKNVKPDGCKLCWDIESAGGKSKRLESNEKYMKNFDETIKPVYLDLKFGTTCNLKCRICGSWSSSKWAQEEIDYEIAKGGDNPLARKQLKEGGWPKRNPQFFEDLKEDLKHAEYFEFTGGEPFMIKDHFKILMYCVQKGYAKNIHIHYNTNGTQLPPKDIFDLWGYFKHVEIAFSIVN